MEFTSNDRYEESKTLDTIKNNISITTYDESNIKENMKIIKGASIKDDNPELIKANELNLNIYEYNEMVGVLTRKFKTVCIAGCHGKTTTTTLLTEVMKATGKPILPSPIIKMVCIML